MIILDFGLMKGKKSSARKTARRKDKKTEEEAKPVSVWSKKDEELAEQERKDEELELETERDSK